MAVPATLFWHDYETSGTNPRIDRPLQFAGVRTDADLKLLSEPISVYCRPCEDVLPEPGAAMVHGITPQVCLEQGLIEADFARTVLGCLGAPGTIGAGYNSIKFDDEVTRNLLYRNMAPPYDREWRYGNGRWDMFTLVMLAHALRPEGIEWPVRDDGKPSLRLEDLARANHVEQARAHDACSDVLATIGLARVLRRANPKLWEYARGLGAKSFVKNVVGDIAHGSGAFVHVGHRHPVERKYSALAASLGAVGGLPNNQVLCVDLTWDLDEALAASPEDLAAQMGKDGRSVGLFALGINKVPAVAERGALRQEDAERLGYTGGLLEQCDRNLKRLRDDPALCQRLAAAMALRMARRDEARREKGPADAEEALYDGFPLDSDKGALARADRAGLARPEDLANIAFTDPRYATLLFRYRARNWPTCLRHDETARWEQHCAQWLDGQGPALGIAQYRAQLAEMASLGRDPEVLMAMSEWGERMAAKYGLPGAGVLDEATIGRLRQAQVTRETDAANGTAADAATTDRPAVQTEAEGNAAGVEGVRAVLGHEGGGAAQGEHDQAGGQAASVAAGEPAPGAARPDPMAAFRRKLAR